jgi:hypothetical protein
MTEKATVLQEGDSFKAEVFVPVWTSQLLVSDWWQSEPAPLSLSVVPQGAGWEVKVQNETDRKLVGVQIAIEDYIFPLRELAPNEAKTFAVAKGQGTRLRDFVSRYGSSFQGAVGARQRTFGSTEGGRLEDLADSTVAASFLSQLPGNQRQGGGSFVCPRGLDLSDAVAQGNAVLFAWAGDYSPAKPIYQFSPRRSHRDTLWRISAPIR